MNTLEIEAVEVKDNEIKQLVTWDKIQFKGLNPDHKYKSIKLVAYAGDVATIEAERYLDREEMDEDPENEWPTETEQELGFRHDVLEMLVADGYQPGNLSLAWMSFKEPKPAEKAEQFLQNGIEKLLFFSAAISADAIHSQYDIPELVYEADYPENFPVINLGAWNDDPIVIAAIKEKIDSLMQ